MRKTMSEDWQIGFRVKGMRAPIQDILCGDYIIIRGIARSADAYVLVKVTTQNKNEKDNLHTNMLNVLRDIIQVYSLVSNHYAEAESSSSASQLTSARPFGYAQFIPSEMRFIPVPSDEQRKENVPFLRQTIEKFEFLKKIYENKKKSYLKNAIDYYHRSLGDIRLEEKLIDLMISLESLFSDGQQELRLRYSLRIAFFLGIEQRDKLPDIFRNVYDLYNKRNRVVHGTKTINLNDKEIWTFQQHLRKAIKRFIHIDMSKQDILKLIDESIYDENKKEQLNKVVSEASKKWN